MNKFQANNQQIEEKPVCELVDIEDNVPSGGNSLFLCVARALIYMSHRNPRLMYALNSRVGIDRNNLKSDIMLQSVLRIKLCEYLVKNGVFFDASKKTFCLGPEYFKAFDGNVYEFLIQIYQMSINNFWSNNTIFRKFVMSGFSKLLGMSVYCKKPNGDWKYWESKLGEEQDEDDGTKYLNSLTVYLQEFRCQSDTNSPNSKPVLIKNYRFLLTKKLWLSNQIENSRICMQFSQFNDIDQIKIYREPCFSINSIRLIFLIMSSTKSNLSSMYQKAFCVLLHKINDQQILMSGSKLNKLNANGAIDEVMGTSTNTSNVSMSYEMNTIGKLFYNFELSHSKESLYVFLNHLLNKDIFDDVFVNNTFQNIINVF